MSDIAAAAVPAPSLPSPPPSSPGNSLWSHGHFSFKDLVDIVNPLQHVPIIGSIYRYLTGDEPSGGARIVGDTIYGGPIGFGVSVVSSVLSDGDGKDLGEHALAAVFGPRDNGSNTAVAAQTQAAPQPMQAASVQPAIIPGQTGQNPPIPSTQMAATLYRSPPAAAAATPPASPEQKFLAQNSLFQRQLTSARTDSGQVLNNRPVPLQLSSNLLSTPRLAVTPPAQPAAPSQATAGNTASPQNAAAPNPIVQKMIDALDKYEQIKRQQEQDDSGKKAVSGVDLSL